MTRSRETGDVGYRAYKKNLIINGNMSIWQRGTTFAISASGIYADRWVVGADAVFTASVDRVDSKDLDLITSPYLISSRLITSAGATHFDHIQKIEDVHTLSGKTVTLSFVGACSKNLPLEIHIIQDFGDGGSTSVTVSSVGQLFIQSYNKYEATLDLPSVSGKTIGPNSALLVYIRVTNPPNDTYVQLSDVQLEEGSSATPFEYVSPQQNLAECQRYYQKSEYVVSMHNTTEPATLRRANIVFPVTMRVIPITSGTQSGLNNIEGTGQNRGGFTISGIPTSQAVESLITSWIADAEL